MELTMRCELPGEVRTEEDSAARERSMDRFLRDVERRAYRIAAVSIGEALDIVQDAMISMVTRYTGKPSDEWRPLFYRILKNRIRDWHRRRIVRQRVLSFFGPKTAEDYDPLETAPSPVHDDPAERTVQDDAMAALEAALKQLPLRQREAFMLRNFEGLDVLETAQAMGCSDGSVKTHYSRAVGKLRELLGEHWQ